MKSDGFVLSGSEVLNELDFESLHESVQILDVGRREPGVSAKIKKDRIERVLIDGGTGPIRPRLMRSIR